MISCYEAIKTVDEMLSQPTIEAEPVPLAKAPAANCCPYCGAKMDGDSDLSEIKALADLPCDSDLEHMTRFAMQQAINKK